MDGFIAVSFYTLLTSRSVGNQLRQLIVQAEKPHLVSYERLHTAYVSVKIKHVVINNEKQYWLPVYYYSILVYLYGGRQSNRTNLLPISTTLQYWPY